MVLSIDFLITIFFGFLCFFPITTTIFSVLGIHIPTPNNDAYKILLILLIIVCLIVIYVVYRSMIEYFCSHEWSRFKCVRCGKYQYERRSCSHVWEYKTGSNCKTCIKCGEIARMPSPKWACEY